MSTAHYIFFNAGVRLAGLLRGSFGDGRRGGVSRFKRPRENPEHTRLDSCTVLPLTEAFHAQNWSCHGAIAVCRQKK